MLAVSVNDRPIDAVPIVERGRVLLPMRAAFTALGAIVSYDPAGGAIVARSRDHSVRLVLGADTARVDGRSVKLDVPARVVAARTYVPLRFIAQAMGAIVGYDARAQLVTVTSTPAATAHVTGMSPAPDAAVSSAYPTISASLATSSAERGAIALTLDGTDVTQLATFDGTTITYMPRSGLARGTHAVAFSGRTRDGQTFAARWSFATTLDAPPDASGFRDADYRFYANGPAVYYPGDWMHFVLVAPPGGHAMLQICGLTDIPMLGSGEATTYTANVPVPSNVWIPSCQVTAVYTAWNGRRTYVPVPVYIGIYTRAQATPRPHPRTTARPVPAGPRTAPTFAPATAAPTPAPAPTPRPVTTRGPVPRPILPRPRRTP